jgi:hypothetical protein
MQAGFSEVRREAATGRHFSLVAVKVSIVDIVSYVSMHTQRKKGKKNRGIKELERESAHIMRLVFLFD